MTDVAELLQLVDALPELYQPIYGHEDMGRESRRACSDRLGPIVALHDALQAHLGRSVRVLDLGCAQGYFSLSLAARGAEVTGVERDRPSVELLEWLRRSNAPLQVRFIHSELLGLDLEELGPFDLVLGLSVFHHVAHEVGWDRTKQMLDRLVSDSGVVVMETALASEPLYWAAAQGEFPDWIREVPFSSLLGTFGTHLSDTERPMIVLSSGYTWLGGQLESFTTYGQKSHAFAGDVHAGARRYYRGTGAFTKVVDLTLGDRAHNISEWRREVEVLQDLGGSIGAPLLLGSGGNQDQAWVRLSPLPGSNLLDLLLAGEELDAVSVISQVLSRLAELEARGWFYTDVRPWNVLIDEVGTARLIDFGSCGREPLEPWGVDARVAALHFIRDVIGGSVQDPFSDTGFPSLFASGVDQRLIPLFTDLLGLECGTTSFGAIAERFQSWRATADTQDAALPNTLAVSLISVLEQRLMIGRQAERDRAALGAEMSRVSGELAAAQRATDLARAELASTLSDLTACRADLEAANESLNSTSSELAAARKNVDEVLNSRSWRLTSPLRKILGAG